MSTLATTTTATMAIKNIILILSNYGLRVGCRKNRRRGTYLTMSTVAMTATAMTAMRKIIKFLFGGLDFWVGGEVGAQSGLNNDQHHDDGHGDNGN
jgi:hypothetical protein